MDKITGEISGLLAVISLFFIFILSSCLVLGFIIPTLYPLAYYLDLVIPKGSYVIGCVLATIPYIVTLLAMVKFTENMEQKSVKEQIRRKEA